MGSAEDVTRHRTAVKELRHNRYLLRQMVDLVPTLIYIYDLKQERNVCANQRLDALLGYTSAELQAFTDGELLPERALRELREHYASVAALPDGHTRTLEFVVRHRDGTLRWLRGTHAPFARDSNGQVSSLIGVAEDITARPRPPSPSRPARRPAKPNACKLRASPATCPSPTAKSSSSQPCRPCWPAAPVPPRPVLPKHQRPPLRCTT